MRYTFRTDTAPNYTICENKLVSSVFQNISLILSTRQGTVPMYREFGLPGKFIDKPIPQYEAIMTKEIKEGIERFEPRAKLISVSFEHNQAINGKVTAIVEVDIKT